MDGLELASALKRREWAALRVLAAAVAYRELHTHGKGSPAAWMAAHDELARVTDRFLEVMQEGGPCPHP